MIVKGTKFSKVTEMIMLVSDKAITQIFRLGSYKILVVAFSIMFPDAVSNHATVMTAMLIFFVATR